MRNRAFTLIELLVVVAIIALLASIALPAFRSAQQHARMAQDANNMKQIGVGFAAYLGDNSDTMFNSINQPCTSGTTCWAYILGPNGTANYVSNQKVFQSPFDTRSYNSSATGANLSYALNGEIPKPPNDAGGVPVTAVTSYTHPSALLILGPCDMSASGNNLKFSNSMTSDVTISSSQLPLSLIGSVQPSTTSGMINVLYGDWHVAPVTYTPTAPTTSGELFDPTSTATQ